MTPLALAVLILLGSCVASHVQSAERVLVPIDARIGTEARGRERGEQAARADIAAGTLKLFESTGPETARDLQRRKVRERLLSERGIRMELGPGCTEPAEQQGFTGAYNDAVAAEAQRRYGPDFWVRLEHEVDRQLRTGPRKAAPSQRR